jgi:hypothetical protein
MLRVLEGRCAGNTPQAIEQEDRLRAKFPRTAPACPLDDHPVAHDLPARLPRHDRRTGNEATLSLVDSRHCRGAGLDRVTLPLSGVPHVSSAGASRRAAHRSPGELSQVWGQASVVTGSIRQTDNGETLGPVDQSRVYCRDFACPVRCTAVCSGGCTGLRVGSANLLHVPSSPQPVNRGAFAPYKMRVMFVFVVLSLASCATDSALMRRIRTNDLLCSPFETEILSTPIRVRQIVGVVAAKDGTDEGVPLEGVTVRVRNIGGTRVFGQVVTDAEGRFHVPVPPGDYQVEGCKEGMNAFVVVTRVGSFSGESQLRPLVGVAN